jgi:putative membrane protein
MTLHDLPTINAILNGTAALLLVYGFILIRQRKIAQHKRVMLSAFGVSCVFLTCYLIYHYNVGSVRFPQPGWVKNVYLTILLTHTVLAVTVPVLAIVTLNRGLSARFDKHRRIARWTFPIWLYVSVTGVVVYLMLYHIYPLNPVVAIR